MDGCGHHGLPVRPGDLRHEAKVQQRKLARVGALRDEEEVAGVRVPVEETCARARILSPACITAHACTM